MRIEKKFIPIVITIDTEDEAKALRVLLSMVESGLMQRKCEDLGVKLTGEAITSLTLLRREL